LIKAINEHRTRLGERVQLDLGLKKLNSLLQKYYPSLHGAVFLKSKTENSKFSLPAKNKILSILLFAQCIYASNQKLLETASNNPNRAGAHKPFRTRD